MSVGSLQKGALAAARRSSRVRPTSASRWSSRSASCERSRRRLTATAACQTPWASAAGLFAIKAVRAKEEDSLVKRLSVFRLPDAIAASHERVLWVGPHLGYGALCGDSLLLIN